MSIEEVAVLWSKQSTMTANNDAPWYMWQVPLKSGTQQKPVLFALIFVCLFTTQTEERACKG